MRWTSLTEAWNHNNAYHKLLLAALPERVGRALDVGCGHGFLAARLARLAGEVDGVDQHGATLDAARRLHGGLGNLRFLEGDLLAMGLPAGRYDVVMCVACLHHMPLEPALTEMARLLRPGGHLGIIGLYRRANLADLVSEMLAVPAHWLHTRWLHRGCAGGMQMSAPTAEPRESLAEIAAAARRVLPGATIRRRLLWRYALLWQKPDCAGSRGSPAH